MNDVLKSLTVGGEGRREKLSGCAYDSSEPLDKRLESFRLKWASTFDERRTGPDEGARLELKYGNDPIAGQIISASEKDAPPRKEQVMLLLESGECVYSTGRATESVPDPAVQRQFADYLRVSRRRVRRRSGVCTWDSTSAGRSGVGRELHDSVTGWEVDYRLGFSSGTTTL